MRLSEDGTPPCLASAPRFSEPFEGWSMDDLGDYVMHYRARVRAGSSVRPPVSMVMMCMIRSVRCMPLRRQLDQRCVYGRVCSNAASLAEYADARGTSTLPSREVCQERQVL